MAIKDSKIAQILQASTQEFLEKGLEAASMHQIAESAKVSKRTLYKYFPTKDKLYSALIDELLDQVYENQVSYSPNIPIKEQLEKVVDNKIELLLSEPFLNMSKIILGEMLKSRKPSEQQLMRMYNTEATFIHWIHEAKEDKQISSTTNNEVMANQFLSILKGQTFYPVIFYFADVKMIDKKAVRDTTVNFFLESFCA